MAVLVVCLVLFLAMAGHSSATYCVCNSGLSDSVYQKNIDYACGAGADCSQIVQNGACYQPNTVKDHCNYACNSYFQRKGQAVGSCDFAGTASQVTSLTSSVASTCVYPSSASTAGTTTTPSNSTPSTTTPTTTPTTGTTTPTTGTTTTPSSSTTTPVFGSISPTGSGGITNTDSGATMTLHQNTSLLYSFILTLLFSGLMCLRV